jgi:hypothetical protein
VNDTTFLPMTSFNKYINGTDPASPTEVYNYMNGLTGTGDPWWIPTGSPPSSSTRVIR